MSNSLLARLTACCGASEAAIEATMALWTLEDRARLVRLGWLDQATEDFRLTDAGRHALRSLEQR